MKKWKLGIIGAGLIADFHAKAIQSLENAELIGICGTNAKKAKKLAEKYNCRSFDSYSDMLNSGDVEISGSKKLKMTDYNIDPPTALMGTMTTGDEVEIEFRIVLKK